MTLESLSRRAALIGAASILASRAQAQVSEAGRIARFVGSVSVLRGAASLAAADGLAILRDDRIVTGGDGRVEIACADGSTLTIGPGSQVAILDASVTRSRRAVVLGLVEGVVRMITGAPAGRGTVQVRTPTAVASVRSTEWVVDVVTGSTGVLAVSGVVTVAGARGDGVVRLAAGQGTDVRAGQRPTAPAPWGAARIASAMERTRLP